MSTFESKLMPQAGVSYGAGASDSQTQRVILASDSPGTGSSGTSDVNVTNTSLDVASTIKTNNFSAVYDSANATGEGETVRASSAGLRMFITSILISYDVEGWVKLQDEDSNALTGKLWLKAGGGASHQFPDETPLICPADKNLEIISEVAGDISCTVTGYFAT